MAKKYTATNIETGETLEGAASELAVLLGVSAGQVYKVQIEGRKVHGIWRIEKEGKKGTKPGWKFPQSMCEEWDALTSPVRRKA